MTTSTNMIQLDTLAQLKLQPVAQGTLVFCMGVASAFDGMGGFYRWDPTASGNDDTSNYNTVVSNRTAIGRWVRAFQRTRDLPHGKLTYIGSTKIFTASGVTNAQGQCTLLLTMDNTANGAAIFTDIAWNDSQFVGNAATPDDDVRSRVVVQPDLAINALKTTTHGFSKANVVTIVLSLLYRPFGAVGANVPVRFRVEGR